jgi:hypothetical protein
LRSPPPRPTTLRKRRGAQRRRSQRSLSPAAAAAAADGDADGDADYPSSPNIPSEQKAGMDGGADRSISYDDSFGRALRAQRISSSIGREGDDGDLLVDSGDESKFRPCPLEVRDDPVREWCFLCNTAQTQAEIEANPRVVKLTNLLDTQYHRTAKDVLCDQAVRYYNKELRPFVQDSPAWSPNSVWDHVTKHAPTPRIAQEQTLETVTALISAITSAGVIGQNCKGEKKVDLQNAKVLLDALKFKTKTLEALAGKRPETARA